MIEESVSSVDRLVVRARACRSLGVRLSRDQILTGGSGVGALESVVRRRHSGRSHNGSFLGPVRDLRTWSIWYAAQRGRRSCIEPLLASRSFT